jgi:hypothetical protein
MDRPGTCIILDKKYNIANSSCHFVSYGSIWTGPSPKKYYMDPRSFGPYNIFLVTDRSIYCYVTLSAMNYLLYNHNFSKKHIQVVKNEIQNFWIFWWNLSLKKRFSIKKNNKPTETPSTCDCTWTTYYITLQYRLSVIGES